MNDAWFDPPNPKCDEECNCDTCHAQHIDDGMVDENAAGSESYQCCIEQMEAWYVSGERCRKHPKDYSEEGYCEGCEHDVPAKVPNGTSS